MGKGSNGKIVSAKYKELIDNNFNKVIAMVEEGCTISAALKSIGIGRELFYRKIDKKQKTLLDTARVLNASGGNYINITKWKEKNYRSGKK